MAPTGSTTPTATCWRSTVCSRAAGAGDSILEIVAAFSRKPRGMKLVVLGRYDPEVPYHKQVMDAASDEVMFPGAIYDKAAVSALRFYSSLYVHGHQVGGTNPSLVEAMGAGSAVLTHGNHFNRLRTATKRT
jgi:hypothetical protein